LIVKTYVVTETHFSFYYAQRSKKGKYLMMETVGIAPVNEHCSYRWGMWRFYLFLFW